MWLKDKIDPTDKIEDREYLIDKIEDREMFYVNKFENI